MLPCRSGQWRWSAGCSHWQQARASFLQVSGLFRSLVGQLLLLGWSFAFFYHLCNGIRHLAWDIDRGFDKHVARKSGLFVVAAAVLLTLVFWGVALAGGAA